MLFVDPERVAFVVVPVVVLPGVLPVLLPYVAELLTFDGVDPVSRTEPLYTLVLPVALDEPLAAVVDADETRVPLIGLVFCVDILVFPLAALVPEVELPAICDPDAPTLVPVPDEVATPQPESVLTLVALPVELLTLPTSVLVPAVLPDLGSESYRMDV